MATRTVSTDTNYSALTMADGDRITITQGAVLTINTDTVQIERILCTTFGTCLVQNTSSTTPIFVDMGEDGATAAQLRFEGGGIIRTRGAWITLGTSDGTAGQTFTLPTNAGGERYGSLAGLQVVDGIDVILFNRVDSLADKFYDEKLGCVYTHDVATGVITFGDGSTGGYVPPNGAIIRVPNIQFRDSHNGTGFNDFDLASSGTADFDICAFDQNYGFNMSSGSSVSVRNTCVDLPRESANFGILSAPVIENFVLVSGMATPFAASACNDIDLNGFRIYGTSASNGHQLSMSNGGGGHIRNGVIISENAAQSSSRGGILFTSANIDVTDVYIATRMNAIYLSSGSGGSTFKRVFVTADGNRANAAGNKGRYAFYALNSANNIFEDCGFWPQTEAEGLVAFYTAGISPSTGTSKFTFNNIDLWAGGPSSPARQANAIFINGAGHRIGNVRVFGDPSSDTVNHSTGSLNPEIVNVTYEDAETQGNDMEWCDGARYELVASPDGIDSAPANNGIDVASLLLRVSNTAQGAYLYRMMGVDNTLGLYNEVTKTGVIAFGNNGLFYMGATGDVVEFETHVHRGIESIQATFLIGSGVGNFSCRFAMKVAGGTYGAYQTFNATNMDAALQALSGYDVDDGLQIKYEITRTASNLTDYLQRIRVDCTIQANYEAPFEVRPTELSIVGLSAGDSIYVEDASNNEKAFEVVTGTSYTMSLPNANAGETWTYVVKRKGYVHQRGSFSITAGSDVSISAGFSEKLQAVGGSMYTGSDVASVGVDFDLATPQMSIDISQASTSPQNVFDKVERALATNDGMKWLAQQGTDTSFQNLGGAGSFLFHQNNIRVRRNAPTDTNAEILAFVFSTDGIAVDETNGPVALFSGTLVKDVWEGIIDDYDDVTGSFGQAIADLLVAAISHSADHDIINEGVQKASILVPHNTDLT